MSYWAGLFKPNFASGVAEGVKVLLMLAYRILAQQKRVPTMGMLPAPRDDQRGDTDEE
jgi:hypothetical protein